MYKMYLFAQESSSKFLQDNVAFTEQLHLHTWFRVNMYK